MKKISYKIQTKIPAEREIIPPETIIPVATKYTPKIQKSVLIFPALTSVKISQFLKFKAIARSKCKTYILQKRKNTTHNIAIIPINI